MFINFTAKYTKIPSGYLGQLIGCPEVLTEGKDLEGCRAPAPGCLKRRSWPTSSKARKSPALTNESPQAPQETCSRRSA